MDFFVVSYANYLLMDFNPIRTISFEKCNILNYATEDMLKWMEADVSALPGILDDKRQDWEDWMIEDENPAGRVGKAEHIHASPTMAYHPPAYINTPKQYEDIHSML